MDTQTIDAAITEALTRLNTATTQQVELQQQAAHLNAQGVALERHILGIEGEIKALRALQVGSGHSA